LKNTSGELQRWLDKLVDGELNDETQRQLLLALESQPDGWRRCALAFVENQVWRREVAGLMSAPADVQTAVAGRSKPIKRSAAFWLSVATGLLVTFTMGTLCGRIWIGEGNAIGQPPDSNFVATTRPNS